MQRAQEKEAIAYQEVHDLERERDRLKDEWENMERAKEERVRPRIEGLNKEVLDMKVPALRSGISISFGGGAPCDGGREQETLTRSGTHGNRRRTLRGRV